MARKATSNSSVLLGGLGIVVLVSFLISALADTSIQWLFVPLVIIVSVWVAAAINRGQR